MKGKKKKKKRRRKRMISEITTVSSDDFFSFKSLSNSLSVLCELAIQWQSSGQKYIDFRPTFLKRRCEHAR